MFSMVSYQSGARPEKLEILCKGKF